MTRSQSTSRARRSRNWPSSLSSTVKALCPEPRCDERSDAGSSSINRIRIDRRRRFLAGNVDFPLRNVAFRLRTARFLLRTAEADRRKAVVRGTISALSQVVAGHQLTASSLSCRSSRNRASARTNPPVTGRVRDAGGCEGRRRHLVRCGAAFAARASRRRTFARPCSSGSEGWPPSAAVLRRFSGRSALDVLRGTQPTSRQRRFPTSFGSGRRVG